MEEVSGYSYEWFLLSLLYNLCSHYNLIVLKPVWLCRLTNEGGFDAARYSVHCLNVWP